MPPKKKSGGRAIAVGSAVILDLGADGRRVEALTVRNRSEPGRPEVESALRGCVLQLLGEDPKQVLFEKRITYGAAQYQWDVR